MTSDSPPQTLTKGDTRHGQARRSLVVIQRERTRTIELEAPCDVVLGRTDDADVRIDDPTLSRRHVRISVSRTARLVDLDSHNGTRLRGQTIAPHAPVELVSGDVIEVGETTVVYRDGGGAEPEPVTGAWAQSRTLARRVRKTSLSVVVLGPTGSGRRTLGAEILDGPHRVLDGRTLDASAIAGLDPGAGPLLLLHCDEIPSTLHVALTKQLQDRPMRTVATATRDLSVLVANLDYYLPLYRALAGVVIHVPSLGNCRSEIPAIAERLLRARANAMGLGGVPRLDRDAAQLLEQRPWPGELAELARCIEATIVVLRGPTIRAADVRLPHEAAQVGDPDQLERQRILDALAACGGNQTQAAKLLKISRRTLVSRLDRYAITRPRKRGDSNR